MKWSNQFQATYINHIVKYLTHSINL